MIIDQMNLSKKEADFYHDLIYYIVYSGHLEISAEKFTLLYTCIYVFFSQTDGENIYRIDAHIESTQKN